MISEGYTSDYQFDWLLPRSKREIRKEPELEEETKEEVKDVAEIFEEALDLKGKAKAVDVRIESTEAAVEKPALKAEEKHKSTTKLVEPRQKLLSKKVPGKEETKKKGQTSAEKPGLAIVKPRLPSTKHGSTRY
mmetsp:Transcript_25264/g.29136  ORF Transcript_25264/g.29136 Transcript_25264/m.29136 type:complete len:134 (-) Transcript_25264:3-404(-)